MAWLQKNQCTLVNIHLELWIKIKHRLYLNVHRPQKLPCSDLDPWANHHFPSMNQRLATYYGLSTGHRWARLLHCWVQSSKRSSGWLLEVRFLCNFCTCLEVQTRLADVLQNSNLIWLTTLNAHQTASETANVLPYSFFRRSFGKVSWSSLSKGKKHVLKDSTHSVKPLEDLLRVVWDPIETSIWA